MKNARYSACSFALALHMAATVPAALAQHGGEDDGCRALLDLPTLTLTRAEIRAVRPSGARYCYVQGAIQPGIRYHVQLPLSVNWNSRFLHWGDGGKDGVLNFADHRVAQGYAVANSNMGHDVGAEPGASFGYNNRQSEIDFAYRAVHLTVNAAKTVIRAYYGKPARYSYHEGCSQGGREGLIAAQRFPFDFDGIVAGAAVQYYQEQNAAYVWHLQQFYRDKFAGSLGFDTDGDGRLDSLAKLRALEAAVLDKCDALDGVKDGVIDDPNACPFEPGRDLAAKMCPNDVNADGCFTKRQIQTIASMYSGPHDSKGARPYFGKARGSEGEWARSFIPTPQNPVPGGIRVSADHVNYLFYENDPGTTPPDLQDLSYKPNRRANPPEFAWWEFNLDDLTAGKADAMKRLMNATEPDLTRFLIKNKGKLLLYHGWCDAGPAPDGSIAYFNSVVKVTFSGDRATAGESVRLFMAPGMGHCSGGPGPNEWDKLAPLVEWVESGKAPERIVAQHRTDGRVDNERPLCAYPRKAVYAGPAGGENRRANWVAANFRCQ